MSFSAIAALNSSSKHRKIKAFLRFSAGAFALLSQKKPVIQSFPRIAAAILIFPCLYTGYEAIRLGVADRYAYQSKEIIEQWQRGSSFDRESLGEALALADRALAWAPDHPDYLDRGARLLMYQARIADDPAGLEQARAHLLHSRNLRPTWPGNWALYIELKDLLHEVDKDLSDSLVRAGQVSAWDPALLQAMTTVGVSHLAGLSPAARQAVLEGVIRGLKSPVGPLPSRMVELLQLSAQGWTIALTRKLSAFLVDNDWRTADAAAYTKLGLILWPLLQPTEKQIIASKIADAVRVGGNRVVQVIKADASAGAALQICIHLPGGRQLHRICKNPLAQIKKPG